tara:strand:+ start:3394 stop:3801 length:408 start_codon:yes stop_codon:yes gene_type:complete
MAHEASIIIGSGIGPLKKEVPVNSTSHESHIRGTNVVLINPEDCSAGGSGLVTATTLGTAVAKLPITPLKYRRAISVMNNSTADTVYVGFDPAMTTATGWPLSAGACISFDLNGGVLLYGVSSGSSTDVRILELS